MGKSDLFRDVSRAVCEVMDVTEDELLRGRREECVDARFVLVGVLGCYLTDGQIAGLMGCRRQAVNYLRNRFEERKRRWSVRVGYEEVSRKILVFGQK